MLTDFAMMLHNDREYITQSHEDPIAQDRKYYDTILSDAIEQIPLHEKTGYVAAIERCPPEVRYREADPSIFLAFENGNVWAAANRLVKYWEWRVLLFGDEMAFEPLLYSIRTNATPTYQQADNSPEHQSMREEFRRLVDDQAITVLPHTDVDGNHILVLDRSRFQVDWDTQMDVYKLLRVAFYNLTLLISKIGLNRKIMVTTTNNFQYVILVLIRNRAKHLDNIVSNFRDILRDAIPARLLRGNVIFLIQEYTMNKLIQKVIFSVHSLISRLFTEIAMIVPHVLADSQDAVQELLPYGFTPEILPSTLGGAWHYPIRMNKSNAAASLYWKAVPVPEDTSTFSKLSDTTTFPKNVASEVEQYSSQFETFTKKTIFDHHQQQQEADTWFKFTTLPSLSGSNIARQLVSGVAEGKQQLNQVISHHASSAFDWETLLNEAIEQIPIHEKTGYLGAIAHCPLEVRNSEANLHLFMCFESGNIWDAASRLVKYWEWRVLLFGESLAYQPIVAGFSKNGYGSNDSLGQTILNSNSTSFQENNFPAGAISEGFRKLIEDQVVVVLPQTDMNGQYIVLYDLARSEMIKNSQPIDALDEIRSIFYVYTTIMQRIGNSGITSNVPGMINLILFDKEWMPKNPVLVGTNVSDMLTEAIPFRLDRIHVVTLQGQVHPAAEFVLAKIKQYFDNVSTIIPHSGKDKNDILEQLMQYGFTPNMIPASMGGTWLYPTKIGDTGKDESNLSSFSSQATRISGTATRTVQDHGQSSYSEMALLHPNLFENIEQEAAFAVNDNNELSDSPQQASMLTFPIMSTHGIPGGRSNDKRGEKGPTIIENRSIVTGLSSGNKRNLAQSGNDTATSSSFDIEPSWQSVNASYYQLYRSYNQETMTDSLLMQQHDLEIVVAMHQRRYWDLRTKLFVGRTLHELDKDAETSALFDDDIGTIETDFIRLVPAKKKKVKHFLLVLDLTKSRSRSQESQRRCFFYFLDQILQRLRPKAPSRSYNKKKKLDGLPAIRMTVLVFLDSSASVSVGSYNDDSTASYTFGDIQEVFPIKCETVHVFLQTPTTMGWFAYETEARSIVSQLMNIKDESNMLQIHTADFSRSKRISTLIGDGIFDQQTILDMILEHSNTTTTVNE